MKLGCYYRAFPGGNPIRSYFDTSTQTVDGVPEDIIKLKNDPIIYQYTSAGEMTKATESTWTNIAETFGLFPEVSLVIGDSLYHTFAITKTVTFVYAFKGTGYEREKQMYTINDVNKQPILFPQTFRSVGLVKTIPEYYDWYQPISLFNVFKYGGGWMVLTKDGIRPFTLTFDEVPNFANMNLMELARSEKDVYSVYQSNGENKYYRL